MNLHPKSDAPIRLQFTYEFHYNYVNNMDANQIAQQDTGCSGHGGSCVEDGLQ